MMKIKEKALSLAYNNNGQLVPLTVNIIRPFNSFVYHSTYKHTTKLQVDFIRSNYKDLKTLNPKFPILIRECSGIEPKIWARYEYGVEKSVALDGLTEVQITKKVEELVKAGANISANTGS